MCFRGMYVSIRLGHQILYLTRRPPKDCLVWAILDLRHRVSDHHKQAGPLTPRRWITRPVRRTMLFPVAEQREQRTENSENSVLQSRGVERLDGAGPVRLVLSFLLPRAQHLGWSGYIFAPFSTRKLKEL